MSETVVLITTYAIKSGKLERFKTFLGVLLHALEAGAPGALAVNAYLNADGTEVSIVQLMRDANSIKDFWRILHQYTGRSLGELADTTDVQVFGSVGDIAIERTRHSTGSRGTVMPEHIDGFARLAPGNPRP